MTFVTVANDAPSLRGRGCDECDDDVLLTDLYIVGGAGLGLPPVM